MDQEVPLRPGQIVAEKYRVVELLGTGGMGMVFAADHLGLDRRVALKVMRPDVWGDEEAAKRFLREARAAVRLLGPHVAKVLDYGRSESGAAYLVMELLSGKDLGSVVAENGPLPIADAVDYVLEACEALAEAHSVGIVHRDVKPANLFLTRDAYGERSIKVLDFGISKWLSLGSLTDPRLTDSRTMVGSPVYMSPEQMRSSRDVDHRTDIWSLGAVLFELVTGQIAWSGDTLSNICVRVATDPAPSLRGLMPSAPEELDRIVARCLEKKPAQRFQHVADLALALSRFGSSRAGVTLGRVLVMSGHGEEHGATTGSARSFVDPLAGPPRSGEIRSEPAGLPTPEATLRATSLTGSDRRRSWGRRGLAAAVALAGVVLAVTSVGLWGRSGEAPPPGDRVTVGRSGPGRESSQSLGTTPAGSGSAQPWVPSGPRAGEGSAEGGRGSRPIPQQSAARPTSASRRETAPKSRDVSAAPRRATEPDRPPPSPVSPPDPMSIRR